jgi:hypothetical protein
VCCADFILDLDLRAVASVLVLAAGFLPLCFSPFRFSLSKDFVVGSDFFLFTRFLSCQSFFLRQEQECVLIFPT